MFACLFFLAALPPCRGASAEVLVMRHALTTGIDGREWDRSFPGATTVDAVHRSVLIRFPGSAKEIAARLASGFVIEKAALVLEFAGTELQPAGYVTRGIARAAWAADPPRWHVVGAVLRRSWSLDGRQRPTFNAFADGVGYWAKFGAADPNLDRFPRELGPAQLSAEHPEARLDVSSLFTTKDFAAEIATRLDIVDQNGFILRKLEQYDSRYRDDNAAEWAVATGGNGLSFKEARLEVSFRRGPRVVIPASALAGRKQDSYGARTTALLSPEDFRIKAAERIRATESAGWRAARIAELSRIGGDLSSNWQRTLATNDYPHYERLVRDVLAMPPRFWMGWHVHDELLMWHLYGDFLPAHAREHVKRWWASWLMPEVPTSQLFHPQSEEAATYGKRTGDWRGRASFFRGGYNYGISTQNFNQTAAMGALLGGAIIGSAAAQEDGSHGLEHFPLRLWALRDGTLQEMLDHYYLSITLSGQKMITDFAPRARDRLIGRIVLDRTLDLIASAYHPLLRRIVSPSERTNLEQVLVTQDGVYTVLHAMSPKGVLNYLDSPFDASVRGMKLWSVNVPPGRVAMQTSVGDWGAPWMSQLVDEKQLPFEDTATETVRGSFTPPLWKRVYLGRHYALASQDIKGATVDVIAQWSRSASSVHRMEELGTLTLRYAVNAPVLAATQGGLLPHAGGIATFQHRNRAIVFTKPRSEKTRIVELAGPSGLSSLSSVIALWNFEHGPQWEIYVDGRRVTKFPFAFKASQLLTINDGATYIGIIPLQATNLGRKDELVIDRGMGEPTEPSSAMVAPALTITSYNLQLEAPADYAALNWPAINGEAFGGFVIEMGDADEYASFDEFSRHMKSAVLKQQWKPAERLLEVSYLSGGELMEAGFSPDYRQYDIHYGVMPGDQAKALVYRRVDGKWPYLPAGIDRESSLTIQGSTGRLQKNGAMLITQPGQVAILQTEPNSGTYTATNPLPEPVRFLLSVPGGVTAEARGKVGLLRISVRPRTNQVLIEAGTHEPDILLRGMSSLPSVTLNGRTDASIEHVQVDGGFAYLVKLSPTYSSVTK